MSLGERLKTVLDPYVSKLGTIPFAITNVSDAKETLYSNTTGISDDGTNILAIYSCTKPLTVACVLQLYEKGALDVLDPVEKYIPEAADLKVLAGWDEEIDEPILKKPKNTLRIIHILSHTSGFTYPGTFKNSLRLYTRTQTKGLDGITALDAKWSKFKDYPLMFEPGTSFCYGPSIDWCGRLVEMITGLDLEDYMKQNIFSKLDMNDSVFRRSDLQMKQTTPYYARTDEPGVLKDMSHVHEQSPEMSCGGQGLFSTIEDLAKFFIMILNEGKSPSGESILSPETIETFMFQDVLPEGVKIPIKAGPEHLVTRCPEDLYPPQVQTSWTCNFLRNETPSPTGKTVGSLTWGGFPNIVFFVDPTKKIAGIWATQVVPPGDQECRDCAHGFEKMVYDVLNSE